MTATLRLGSESNSSVTAVVRSIARKTFSAPSRGTGLSRRVPTLSQLESASERGAILFIAATTFSRAVFLPGLRGAEEDDILRGKCFFTSRVVGTRKRAFLLALALAMAETGSKL